MNLYLIFFLLRLMIKHPSFNQDKNLKTPFTVNRKFKNILSIIAKNNPLPHTS